MDRLISLEPSNVVAIRVEPGQRCYGELTLRNVMYTMPVAFRIQAMNRARYAIRPQSGIIPPLATLTVEITYLLPTNSLLPDSFPHSDDSFLLHSVVAPGAAAKDPSSTHDAVPSDWFSAKKKQVFIDSAIKIMFVGSSVLARLVVDGLMDELREVLDRSDPDWRAVDSSDSAGQTLLHLAIARSRPDLVQLLLEFEPNLEAPGRAGRTPLEAAAAAGEALIAEILLSRRASSDRSSTSPWGPIHLTAAEGHQEVLRLLLLKGAHADAVTDDGRTALHLAVEGRRRECAEMLMAAGCKVDVRGGSDGGTVLHVASLLGDESMVKLLLLKGANKEIRNYAGKTAYDVAAERGHTKLFDVLKLGDSLSAAARKGEVRSVHRLMEDGASVNGRDQHGWTALMRAGFKGRVEVMQALLEKGAEVDARDQEGYTALHCAVEAGHSEAVEMLIKRGADLEARTAKGATVMQIAGSLGYAGIARILVRAGAAKDAGAADALMADRGLLSLAAAAQKGIKFLGIGGAGRERQMSEKKEKKGSRMMRWGVAGGLPKVAVAVASH